MSKADTCEQCYNCVWYKEDERTIYCDIDGSEINPLESCDAFEFNEGEYLKAIFDYKEEQK